MTRHRKILIFLLGTLSAFGPLSMDMYLPALPALQADLHTSQAGAQLSITACLLGLALGQIFIGPLSDHFGRRKPLLVGVFIYALTSGVMILVPRIEILITLRFIQGLGGSAGQVLARSIARDQFSGAKLSRFIGVLMAINGLFPIIAPILGGVIIHFTPWQGVFAFLGLLGLVLFLGICYLLPESLPLQRRQANLKQAFRDLGSLAGDRQFMNYVLTQGFILGGLFIYIAGSTFIFQGIYHFSPQAFSLLYAFNGLGIVLGSNLVGQLVNKISEEVLLRRTLIAGLGVAGLTFGLMLVQPQAYILISGLFLMMLVIGIVNTAATAQAMNLKGQQAGGASALIGLVTNIIGGLATPLVGGFNSHSPLPMIGLILGAWLIGIGIYFLLPKNSLS
ncbi:multidrug effflux MFS transporter [Lactobacillus sp. DCY120]|uniref:Bcr/CflA family efflux transporter n=1 Tax=Bombilactobacillus apium TaxID=2675299 RepID=A0A850R3P7_9LACO|nr:multidrug effflux MFS transporter [Bombilactobacillus apium]NVY96990.1 multidrug effflux MFS transporter [Bombilactobacillus apium]